MLFNNQPAVIDDDFLVSIPEKGSSFDCFVWYDYVLAKMDSALSTRRLHKILRNLRMLEELKEADLRP